MEAAINALHEGKDLSGQDGMLTDLHNRGVEDILIACVDGLTGFPEAIERLYPDTQVQHCIINRRSADSPTSKALQPSETL